MRHEPSGFVGNVRTIMVVHAVLAQRAGFSVDWASTGKTAYLQALTKELDDPAREFSMNISNRTSDRRSLISKTTLQRPRASTAAQAMPIKFAAATTIRQS
jgi:fido (protein-threonine AMPylation protein)